jgi:sulfide:quinone oxidoreductase
VRSARPVRMRYTLRGVAEDPLRVVVAGGGVAGLEAIMALRAFAGDRVAITLLEPAEEFVHKPMSVGSPFARRSPERLPLKRIASDFDVEHVRDSLARVRTEDHAVVTAGGTEIGYGALLLAPGGRREPAVEHAITFRGPEDDEAVHGLVQDVEGGYARRIAFVVPGGVTWPLPLYELALMLAGRAREMGVEVGLAFVTPEESPLEVVGPEASPGIARLLAEAGIEVHTSSFADVEPGGRVWLRPEGRLLEVERVVALPVLEGPAVPGIGCDERGFIPVGANGQVEGAEDVYAAGDGTLFPIKQGGVAAQQADVAAAAIARRVGVEVDVAHGEPVVRVKLLTGRGEHFAASGGGGLSEHALWWPPGKVAGAYLAPYLAGPDAEPPPGSDVHELEIPLGS